MKAKILVLFIASSALVLAQKSHKVPKYFSEPFLIDSSSTVVLIPTLYNAELFSSSTKLALRDNFYANIIFYNCKTDTYKKLFVEDTFIEGFKPRYISYYEQGDRTDKLKNVSSKWIFYFVKAIDYNKNGRIDSNDPSILYVSDKNGDNLRAITSLNENAESIQIFDKQGYALIKMQRDLNNDMDFDYSDKDYYYVRLDLSNLTLGNKIELVK